jgi:alcohol dehydrogenase/propanol-preferring alcohol dehydrogenase
MTCPICRGPAAWNLARRDVQPMIEVFPQEKADEAYQRLINGELRFKAVVTY